MIDAIVTHPLEGWVTWEREKHTFSFFIWFSISNVVSLFLNFDIKIWYVAQNVAAAHSTCLWHKSLASAFSKLNTPQFCPGTIFSTKRRHNAIAIRLWWKVKGVFEINIVQDRNFRSKFWPNLNYNIITSEIRFGRKSTSGVGFQLPGADSIQIV